MSAIPVKEIKRNRSETRELKHVPVPSINQIRVGTEILCFTCGGCT